MGALLVQQFMNSTVLGSIGVLQAITLVLSCRTVLGAPLLGLMDTFFAYIMRLMFVLCM